MRKTPTDRKNDLINALVEARQSLIDAVASIPPERIDQPCIGFWCVKDLLAHLIGWDETNRGAVEEILAGQRPSFLSQYDKDWQTYNAGLVARYRKENIADLLADAENSHRRLVEYLQSLAPEQVLEGKSPAGLGRPVTARNLLRAEAGDECKHAEMVLAFFGLPKRQIDA